ncbi:MAG: hypothetical protein KDE50_00890 [Caldilineaceae bacterium]|nr:hypothetical protein [Caldilineaceae bacterium]MCB0138442.1 hypothetical protein [Caldilineaceae bacterium]
MDKRMLDLLAAFAQLDPHPQITSVLMEFAQLPRPLVRYMAGPVIIHRSPWAETLPDWMLPAIYADRAELIAREAGEGMVGELATPLEVVAYMYPATLDAPLSYEWVQVYLYCGQAALTKHHKLPADTTFAQAVLGENQPLHIEKHIHTEFLLRLQRDIRRKVVQVAADRGVAKQSRPASAAPAASAPTAEEQAAIPHRPLQMRLFELGE